MADQFPDATKKVLSPAAAVMIAYWKGQEASQQLGVAAALKAAADAGRRGPEHWEGSQPDDFDKGWEEALDWIAWVAAELRAQ